MLVASFYPCPRCFLFNSPIFNAMPCSNTLELSFQLFRNRVAPFHKHKKHIAKRLSRPAPTYSSTHVIGHRDNITF